MILRDWRDADSRLLRSCYEREQRSWQIDLGWDTTWTWATVEHARVSLGLPGLLALDDDGTVQGWAFSMKDGATLHIGGLVASSQPATTALLWKASVGGSVANGPMTYSIGGRQYIAFTAGSSLFAYALRQN